MPDFCILWVFPCLHLMSSLTRHREDGMNLHYLNVPPTLLMDVALTGDMNYEQSGCDETVSPESRRRIRFRPILIRGGGSHSRWPLVSGDDPPGVDASWQPA